MCATTLFGKILGGNGGALAAGAFANSAIGKMPLGQALLKGNAKLRGALDKGTAAGTMLTGPSPGASGTLLGG